MVTTTKAASAAKRPTSAVAIKFISNSNFPLSACPNV
ncbi:hypothetical protein QFZ20_001907 [Flavobacterium sp. W4I14]|nr:hypothetical protein [Flavobacterium sp. W4I14]